MPLVLAAHRQTGRLYINRRVAWHRTSIAAGPGATALLLPSSIGLRRPFWLIRGRVATIRRMVTLRPAEPEDEDRLLEWRNEPSTRGSSFTQEVISTDDHHVWLARKLGDPACALLIIEDAGRPVGQVRLDRIAPDLAEVSIGLSPEVRGQGFGREALCLAAREAAGLLGVANIRALVKRGNDISLGAFRAAGFRDVRESGSVIELQRPTEPGSVDPGGLT